MGNLTGEGTMAVPATITRTNHTTRYREAEVVAPQSGLRLVYNLKSILTKTGVPLFINMILAALCLALMLACLGQSDTKFQTEWDVVMYLVAAAITLILLIAVLFIIIVRRFFGLNRCLHGLLIVICVVGIILVLVGAIATAANADRSRGFCGGRHCYPHWDSDVATAAAVFGFLAAIGIVVQIVFHVRDLRSNAYADNSA